MISAYTLRPVRRDVAMTGEITLRGEVLPIGGVKEKVLAARQAKISTVILPRLNRRDVEQIGVRILHGMEFQYVDTVEEVLAFALRPAQKAPPPAEEAAETPRPRSEIPVAAREIAVTPGDARKPARASRS